MRRSRKRLPNSSIWSCSLKIPSIGSEKAPISRDNPGKAVGGARIIGKGEEEWTKEERKERTLLYSAEIL